MVKKLTQQKCENQNSVNFKSYLFGIILLGSVLFSSISTLALTLPAGFSQVLIWYNNSISGPTALAFAPDGRLFIAEQTGGVRIIKNGAVLATPFLSLSVNATGERGVIGIAIDPNFASNQYIYLYYTIATGANNRISRFTANGDVAVPGSEVVVLDLDPLSGATNHNGGSIQFGIDGKLYVGVGDNANGANAQNLDSYMGKVLRINSDGSVPAGNPFTTGSAQRKRVWGYGFRNPYTLTIQPVSGKIFVNDVGENTWEEINDCTTGGLNFGWPNAEGVVNNPLYKDPIYAYGHGSGTGIGCAISGGVFYNPASGNYPASYTGKYFFHDYCNNWIDMLTISGSTATRTNFATAIAGNPASIVVGPDGNLYFTSRAGSSVYKITYTGTPTTTNLSPVADSYVRSGSFANTNFGTAAKLNIKKNTGADANHETFLRFNLSAVSSSITSAKLRFYGSLSSTQNATVSIEAHYVTDSTWLENSITWNNKPAAQASVLATTTVTGITKQYYYLDVTQQILALKTSGKNYVTLKVNSPVNSICSVQFNSKEATSYKPKLVIETTSPRFAENEIQIADDQIDFVVYPNPSSDNFNIKITNCTGSSVLLITDYTGKLVKQIDISNNDEGQQINTVDLKSGLYFLTIKNESRSSTKKLSIQK